MTKYRLIIDLATDRVIYYTSDKSQELTTDVYSVMCPFNKDIPSSMNMTNCRNFKYINKELVTTSTPRVSKEFDVVNVKSSLNFIDNTVEEKKKSLVTTISDSIYLQEAKLILDKSIDDSKWIRLTMADIGVDSLDDAAHRILDYQKYRSDTLYKIEVIQRQYYKKISDAKTNAQLLEIRKELRCDLYEIPFKKITNYTSAWLDSYDFEFTLELETNYLAIQREALMLLNSGMFKDQQHFQHQTKIFSIKENLSAAPVTWKILSKFPSITNSNKTAIYFSLAPSGTSLDSNRNSTRAGSRTRHQLCLTKPMIDDSDKVFIRVGDETRSFELGKILSFNDSFVHDNKNLSNQNRLVLIFDSIPIEYQ